MQQIICYSDCAIDKGSLILLLRLKRLYIFAMLDSLLIKQSFGKCLSATPTKRLQKMQWLDDHKNHVHQLTYTHFDTIIIDDLITAGLSPYSNAWETFFKELLNLGIVGDCTQHILFQVEHLPVPSHLKYVIHCGTNNVSKDNLSEIVKCILCIALLFKKRNPSLKIIINRIFSEGYGKFSHFHIIVPQIKQLLEIFYLWFYWLSWTNKGLVKM